MKFSLAAVPLFVAAAMAQVVSLSAPTNGQTISSGQQMTVQVTEPDSNSSWEEVAVVVGISSCSTSGCPSAEEDGMQYILYNGQYKPAYPNPNPQHVQPYQDFTVTLPATLAKGEAVVSVAHFALIGASYVPYTGFANVTVSVA
ncbi:hypothetical protein CONPUDRAFT_124063 [Coniophora puteana RWD-64-598 SS2]|uniref:Uncharacterized protein n=1 Tax=Coniophora puteana (strain RWD-64-598) TaxID=741705 RepID=A0A5M3MPV7_CONPW|nr:uncharacterized protein CONPUDRAFT_124063 [Coniophora puteana RWD-64-598 SS2]EIW81110.1 hypothetical protein CONPUDRAFT_124063 [Coniophora puteana RWD-64-598 SS2]